MIWLFVFHLSALAKVPGPADQLEWLKKSSGKIEEELAQSIRDQSAVKSNLKKIKDMQSLHVQQKVLTEKRVKELEGALSALEERRVVLQERIAVHQQQVRRKIADLFLVDQNVGQGLSLSELATESPRRRILEKMVSSSLKEMEAFRVDLADADSLEEQIQRERQQLTFVAQDLIERESVMELSKQLQLDLLSKRKADRALQLERYRELKRAEAEVEKLLSGFKARIELEKVIEEERKEDRKLATSFFGRMKGKLSLPVAGPVVGEYGKAFDSASGLFVFKKGIDISAGPARVVTAVASGKVAFSGAMPGLGQVVIIDQGDNYYTLLGRLSASKVKTDDSVTEGTEIGLSSESGDPVYFEIRSRNIPVNPLLWVSR